MQNSLKYIIIKYGDTYVILGINKENVWLS